MLAGYNHEQSRRTISRARLATTPQATASMAIGESSNIFASLVRVNQGDNTVKPDTRQLQFFNLKTRLYEPSAHQSVEVLINPRIGAAGRPWRIARAERPLKPWGYVSPHYTASARRVDEVQQEYLAWAQKRDLQHVTAFGNKSLSNYKNEKLIFTGKINQVTPNDYFHVEEITL